MGFLRTLICAVFLIAASFGSAYAETIAATYVAPGADSVSPTMAFEANGVRYSTFNCSAVVTDWPAGSCGQQVPTYYVDGYCGRFFNNSYCSNTTVIAVRTCGAGYSLVSNMCVNQTALYKCPTGQDWTLSGQTCTRPDCVSTQVRDSNGICQCESPKTLQNGVCKTPCPSGYHALTPDTGSCEKDCFGDQTEGSDGKCKCTGNQSGLYGQQQGTGLTNPACANGCQVMLNPVQFCPKGALAAFGVVPVSTVTCYAYGSTTGNTCGTATGPSIPVTLGKSTPPPGDTSGKGADGVTPEPKNTPENNKDPVACGGAGGSYIQVNGVGKCISDAAISPADKMAKVTSTVKSETTVNADNTTTTKETTTTTSTGPNGPVSSSTTKTTTKDAAGNITGSSTTGSGTSQGDDGFCAKNPELQICKGGLNEEVTQKKVEEHLKAIRDGLDPAGFEPESFFADLDASEEDKQKATDKLAEYLAEIEKFGTANDPAHSKYEQFKDALSDGWFEPIVVTGCTPFSAQIGPWTWNFDHCSTAAKISAIGAYCMWVLLAFGIFNRMTREGR